MELVANPPSLLLFSIFPLTDFLRPSPDSMHAAYQFIPVIEDEIITIAADEFVLPTSFYKNHC